MNKITKTAIAVSALLVAGAASAASIDFRHEYKSHTHQNADRIKIGGGAGNHYFGVEMKFNQADKRGGVDDFERGDAEFEYGYKFYFQDKKWLIQPGMPITMGDHNVTYKPQVRVAYKFDNGVTTKLRYRHEFREYSNDDDAEGKVDYRKSKVTFNLEKTWDKVWQTSFEANYEKMHQDGPDLYDNDDWNYDYQFKFGYKIPDSSWRPYVDFSDVSVGSSSETRQLRSRVGVTYSF